MINKILDAVLATKEKINNKSINWDGYAKEWKKDNNLETFQRKMKKASLYFYRRDNPRSKISDEEYKQMFNEWLNTQIVKNTKKENFQKLPWWRINKHWVLAFL
jgi:hypothetical protein